jgi:hypothetical protein
VRLVLHDRDELVFMDEPAQPIPSADGPQSAWRKSHELADWIGGIEVQGAMRTLPVVVVD